MSTATSARPVPHAPEVSVVVGVRDGAVRLEPALRSILAQREVDLELVVVDDGSTDHTPEMLRTLGANDARVRIIRQEPLGLTAALVRGCGDARGRFIARQDADEVSHPARLRRQLAAFDRHPELALVSCWTQQLAPEGEPLRVERGRGAADQPVVIFEQGGDGSVRVVAGPGQHGSTMFPAALYRHVGGYRPAFAAGQDWDLWLRLAEHGPFLIVGDVLLSTALDVGSLSFTVRDLQIALGEAATEALAQRLSGGSEAESLARAAALSRRLEAMRRRPRWRTEALGHYHIGELLRQQRHPAALRYLLRAVRRNPLLLRGWIRSGQAVLAGAVERGDGRQA